MFRKFCARHVEIFARQYSGASQLRKTARHSHIQPTVVFETLSTTHGVVDLPIQSRASSRMVASAVRKALAANQLLDAAEKVQQTIPTGGSVHKHSKGILRHIPQRHFNPSRLTLHSFVHGLIRRGSLAAAALHLQMAMEDGVRVNKRTLLAAVQVLSGAEQFEDSDIPFHPGERERQLARNFRDEHLNIAQQYPSLALGTRLAIQILRCARRTRNKRTRGMYERVIDACLLQGEIMVACLLFVLLIRDWQLRAAIQSHNSNLAETVEPSSQTGQRSSLSKDDLEMARALGYQLPWMPIPKPTMGMLSAIRRKLILPGAQRNLHAGHDPDLLQRDLDKEIVDSIRGLCLLTEAIDHYQFPFEQVASLLHAMGKVPSEPVTHASLAIAAKVSPSGVRLRDEGVITVRVYDYVHHVLRRLMASLLQPTGHFRTTPDALPTSTRRIYNFLLHYSLRHKLDLASAQTLLSHMTTHRDPPITPNITTYNTLLRGASLLRRNDVVQSITNFLPPLNHNGEAKELTLGSNEPESQASGVDRPAALDSDLTLAAEAMGDCVSVPRSADFALLLSNLATDLSPPQKSLSVLNAVDGAISMDAFTLSSYIANLSSTNQTDEILGILFKVLPEVNKSWKEMWLARANAAKLGRYFFSTIINHLSKAGRTGLAERVWHMARLGEEASWDADSLVSGGSEPWVLDITAYTAMLSVYRQESRRGLLLSARSHPVVIGWGFNDWLRIGQRPGSNTSRRDETSGGRRWMMAREAGLTLVRSMFYRSRELWSRYIESSERWATDAAQPPASQNVNPPEPDARFYNVLLAIFGRRYNMQRRSQRGSRRRIHYRNYFDLQRYYVLFGEFRRRFDPVLLEIAADMSLHGFRIPIGLRAVTIGSSADSGKPPPKDIRPWSYPTPSRYHIERAYTIRTPRTKGLPIGRRRYRNGAGHSWRDLAEKLKSRRGNTHSADDVVQ